MQDLRASLFEGRRLGYSADAEVGRAASGDLYDRYGTMQRNDKDAVAQIYATPCMQRYGNDRECTSMVAIPLSGHCSVIGDAEGYCQTMCLTANCTPQV